jgi:hypothetical protein
MMMNDFHFIPAGIHWRHRTMKYLHPRELLRRHRVLETLESLECFHEIDDLTHYNEGKF